MDADATTAADNRNLVLAFVRNRALDSIAIAEPDGREWSYRELFDRAARMSRRLVGVGVRPGDRVAVQVSKSRDVVALYLASLMAGGVYVPLNDAYTDAELGFFLQDAEPRVFVTDPRRAAAVDLVADLDTEVLSLGADGVTGTLLDGIEAEAAEPAEAVIVHRDGDDLAAILYTSGTTGRSKGAMLTHANLLSNARSLAEAWNASAADRLLHALPIYHIHGLFVACNLTFLTGASLLLLPKFDVAGVLAALPAANVMMGVPTFYTRLLADPRLDAAATRHVRVFISGSAPLLPETQQQWSERTGHGILERYGMTETNMIASNPYSGERRAGTVGLPLLGVEVRIVDEASARLLPPGEIGMIEVRGPNVFAGYWRLPDKTAQEFRADGFFVTGDLGRIGEDGYLEIVGREKDLIISGGLNVYPKEIETEIDAIDGVEESAVIGVPHGDFGEAVTAVVVRSPGARLDAEAILAVLATRLARFKLPKTIHFTEELPRNAMGKVQKAALRDRYR